MNQKERLNILTQYSTFGTVGELVANVDFFVKRNHLKKSEFNVLKYIADVSKNYLGACWLKVRTIVNKLGISDSTVRRATRSLEKLGIIKKVRTTREKTGGDGSNVYIIQRLCDSAGDIPQMTDRQCPENPDLKALESQDSEANILSSKNISKKDSEYTKRKEGQEYNVHFDHSFVSDHVEKDFIELIKGYFDDASIIENLWSRVKLVEKCSNLGHKIDYDLIESAFKILVRKYKEGKIRGDIFGYFFGILKKKVERQIMIDQMLSYIDNLSYKVQNSNQSSFVVGNHLHYYENYLPEEDPEEEEVGPVNSSYWIWD